MRAVMLEVDERLIAERQRLGLDKRDEMWEGVLHMVPPASRRHQKIETKLLLALSSSADRSGWEIQPETGVFGADDDYKVPDIVVFDEAAASDRGVDGSPKLVIEIRSSGDETMEKIPWYLAHGAGAVLVVDRDSLALELHTPDARTQPDPDGTLFIPGLAVRLRTDGTTLYLDGAPIGL
jgi:Uma2 family endonuclease